MSIDSPMASESAKRKDSKKNICPRDESKDYVESSYSYNELPDYPTLIEQSYQEPFNAQFTKIVDVFLKDKLNHKDIVLGQCQKQVKKSKTLVFALEDCILKTSLYKDDLPKTDGFFTFKMMRIYFCFRNDLRQLMMQLSDFYEIIIWSSSARDYTKLLIDSLQEALGFTFDHWLSIEDQVCSI